MILKPLAPQSTDSAESRIAVWGLIDLHEYHECRPRLIDAHLGADPR